MKTELEVLKDALRQVGFGELADDLNFAIAAARHRVAILSALQGGNPNSVVDCTFSSTETGPCTGRSQFARPHLAVCPYARALRALDPEWSERDVEASREYALLFGDESRGSFTLL